MKNMLANIKSTWSNQSTGEKVNTAFEMADVITGVVSLVMLIGTFVKGAKNGKEDQENA